MNLIDKNEVKLFVMLAMISALIWLALVVFTRGIVLVWVPLLFVAYLFAQSGFISHLKGNGIRITAAQYPDIHRSLADCCQKIGLDDVPDTYLLRTDFFNALATRFLRRNFIVLFTDVLDALSKEPAALDFYVGHELGHIHRNHLGWNTLLFPALTLPVLGTAYRRAQEYTCDRYGAHCCGSDESVRSALSAMCAGNSRWKELNTEEFFQQIPETSGFWMSFHELISDYPWQTKRMASALAFRCNEEIRHPKRNFFAALLSVFVPRFGAGGGASLMITIAMIAVLVAIAVPAYNDYTIRAKIAGSISETASVKLAVGEYAMRNDTWPNSLVELGFESETIVTNTGGYEIGLYDDGIIGIALDATEVGEQGYVVLEPNFEEGTINWICYGQDVAARFLPVNCR